MKISLRGALAGAFAFSAFAAPAAVLAHDVWVVPVKQDGLMTARLHYGDPSHLEVPDSRKVVSLEIITPTGRTSLKSPLAITTRGPAGLVSKAFPPPPPGSIIAVAYDNGYWAEDRADGVESNTSKLLIPNAKDSWWVPKFGKTLLGPGAQTVKTGALMELTALADPFGVAVGQTLSVRLDYRGKPLAGVEVSYTDGVAAIPEKDRPVVKTDAAGVAAIPIARKGPYLLTAEQVTPPSNPQLSDHDEVYATLAFDTGK